MKLFVTALPVFDSQMAVEAYWLSYHDSSKLFGLANDFKSFDGAMHMPGVDLLEMVGVEPFTGGKQIFVHISEVQLLAGTITQSKIEPGLLICVLSKDIPPTDNYYDICKALVQLGYTLAIEYLPYNETTAKLYELCKYVVFDYSLPSTMGELLMLSKYLPRIRALLLNVSSIVTFEGLKSMSNLCFEGSFYNQPISKTTARVSPIKANCLQLLKLAGEEDTDITRIVELLNRDVSLPISLLKFINSPAFALSRQIDSIQQAVTLLGLIEMKKWIMMIVSTQIAEDSPSEISKLSLIRAKFAENLAPMFKRGDLSSSSMFLLGLFSLIDVVLEKPMAEAIDEISVNPRIRDALVLKAGVYYDVLHLIYSYERADWAGVGIVMMRYGLEADDISNAFISSLTWYRDFLQHIQIH